MCALIGNLQLANPIIRIQQDFHNTKYLPRLQNCIGSIQIWTSAATSDQYQNADIEMMSEWHI